LLRRLVHNPLPLGRRAGVIKRNGERGPVKPGLSRPFDAQSTVYGSSNSKWPWA